MKRAAFRKRCFLLVFVLCAAVLSISVHRVSAQSANRDKAIAHRVYAGMAEQASLAAALFTDHEVDPSALELYSTVIDTYVSMLGEETVGTMAASAAASVFRGLSARVKTLHPLTEESEDAYAVYGVCADLCAQQLAILSEAVLSDDRELIIAVGGKLISLADEIAEEQLVGTQNASVKSYSFAREKVLTPAQAQKLIKKILGEAVSLMRTPVTADADGNYLFQCRNAYAVVSASGGHLLRYSFYTKTAEEEIVSRCLNAEDLGQEAILFLEKNGIRGMEITEDASLHGVRYYQCTKPGTEERRVRIGVREWDGRIVYADLDAFYRVK